MKFSLSWLKDHLDTGRSDADAIARKLTALGLEIEGVEDASAALGAFRIARVLTAEKHPQADKLQVLSVDLGDGAPLQVVCARPMRARASWACWACGAVVPANGMELRKSAIRGVRSNGMMCSTRELGLGEEHDGIIELPADAPVGATFADYLGSDPVFDVAITPNRPDCMGVYGIARDLAAAGLGTLKPVDAAPVAGAFLPGGHPHRGCRRLPGVLWPRDPGREERPFAAMAAGPAQERGPAPDLGAGGRDQLCHARLWPPGARL
jgi:phenylalanyl-tRNA synthetase beta chain